MFGAIEAGGTKFVCAVGTGPENLLNEIRFPTTTPDETLQKCIAFFQAQSKIYTLSAIGIACFGPINLDPTSPTYGYITSTPKPGWQNTSMVKFFENTLQIPVAFDTDVNAAALAESYWGAGQGFDPLLYLTIGTGIGGGGIVNGSALHGLLHPEMGHISIPHDWQADPFPGICPFHGDCFEGLASGPAMKQRWGKPAETLPDNHPAWSLEANYIARALANLIYVISPRRIILGGGVMQNLSLFPLIHTEVQKALNQYIQSPAILENVETYIVPPALGNRAGILGALALAMSIR